MTTLLKKDFLLNDWKTYLGIAFFLFVTYMMTLPPTFMFVLAFVALAFSSFTYDDKVNVQRFLVSLPVDKSWIIWSRYIYSLSIAVLTLIFQFILMNVLQAFLHDSFYVYNSHDLITLFCIGAVIIAICHPIIYFFRSLFIALGIILFLFWVGTFLIMDELVTVLQLDHAIIFNEVDVGFALLVEKYFPWQPYLIILIITGIIVYFSVTISIKFFIKKEL